MDILNFIARVNYSEGKNISVLENFTQNSKAK